jgi:hypothetical protein
MFAVSLKGVGRDLGSPGEDGGDPAPSAACVSALASLASFVGIDLPVLDSSVDVWVVEKIPAIAFADSFGTE